jgi:hypothetical protein
VSRAAARIAVHLAGEPAGAAAEIVLDLAGDPPL